MITLDAETEGIVGNPLLNPPKPVGMGIKYGDLPTMYLTNWDEMRHELQRIWNGNNELIFQNAPFDLAVINRWFGLPFPAWEQVHDTKYLIYLFDPHAKNMSLKPSAQRILAWEAEERDELREWILDNVKGATKKTWGAYICEAPPALVGKYCKADCDMTYALFRHLITKVPIEAYNRERELAPYLSQASVRGIRCDLDRLERDLTWAEAAQDQCEKRIQTHLGVEFDVHNSSELADALDKAGKIEEWKYTPTGKRSTARANLMSSLGDPVLLSLLSYAGAMQTCLTTFMRPWIQLASGTGRLHPSWNQIKGDDDYGTRTGRLSCSQPNLQNVPNEFNFSVPDGLPGIPKMRDYLLPEEGHVWVSRDFSAQEIRLMAHFEAGDLCRAFQADPDIDPHALVQELIAERTGVSLTRKQVKGVAFGILYGMGVPGLSRKLGVETVEAQAFVSAYFAALPGARVLKQGTQNRGRYGQLKKAAVQAAKRYDDLLEKDHTAQEEQYLRKLRDHARLRVPRCDYVKTIGGRRYRVETPKLINGKLRTFDYKLLNYLIQGSAADQTKQALLSWFRNKPENHQFLATVHDEINISMPIGDTDLKLEQAMERDFGLSVPMRTTLSTGPAWGAIE